MHGSFDTFAIETLPFDAILNLDRALRTARSTVLAFGRHGELAWSILLELAPAADGLGFADFVRFQIEGCSRTDFIACLSELSDAGLIAGETGVPIAPGGAVRMTPQGHAKIAAVLALALAILRRSK